MTPQDHFSPHICTTGKLSNCCAAPEMPPNPQGQGCAPEDRARWWGAAGGRRAPQVPPNRLLSFSSQQLASSAQSPWTPLLAFLTIPFPSPGGPPLRGTVSYYNSAVFNFTSMESYGCFVSAVYSIGTHFL